jgi:hypothetical protein
MIYSLKTMELRQLFGFKKNSDVRQKQSQVEFYVPDKESAILASNALSRIKIPLTPRLRTLQTAYTAGESILDRLRGRAIRIIEQKGKTKEETYRENEKIIQELSIQRNALVQVIEQMIHPTINAAGDMSIQIDEQRKLFFDLVRRIDRLEVMMKNVYGQSPTPTPLPGAKEVWRAQLKEAAQVVCSRYKDDLTKPVHEFKDLHDASNQFWDAHYFMHKPNLEKEQFYANVRKVASELM